MDFTDLKVTVVGSGNWGTAVARLVGNNLLEHYNLNNENLEVDQLKRNETINMWVYEEVLPSGEKLSEVINTKHENVKYLPNIKLPRNIKAVTSLVESCRDANVLLFVIPHQFLHNILNQLKDSGVVNKDTICVSFIKGVDTSCDEDECEDEEEKAQGIINFKKLKMKRYTEIIEEVLEVENVMAVMGANVASDIAEDFFAESTIGTTNLELGNLIKKLLANRNFIIQLSNNISTVEYCGALKNIIAIGAGICDGLGYGCSTKAALIRQGLEEMELFCNLFYDSKKSWKENLEFDKDNTIKNEIKATMNLSCGVADLIATCYGGRNRKCGEEFVRRFKTIWEELRNNYSSTSPYDQDHGKGDGVHAPIYDHKTIHHQWHHTHDGGEHIHHKGELKPRIDIMTELWEDIEKDLLNGQKLQGVSTCVEVMHYLTGSKYLKEHPKDFPLIRSIYAIACQGEHWDTLFQWE